MILGPGPDDSGGSNSTTSTTNATTQGTSHGSTTTTHPRDQDLALEVPPGLEQAEQRGGVTIVGGGGGLGHWQSHTSGPDVSRSAPGPGPA
eukprot:3475790-Rhodomonas_salina.2